MRLFFAAVFVFSITLSALAGEAPLPWDHGPLRASPDGRFLQHADGIPFFWLGDTAWLLFANLDRDEIPVYLDDRASKGFNVVQVMVIHNAPARNGHPWGIGTFENSGTRESDPPRKPFEGNDWVLVLDDAARDFPMPGSAMIRETD